jgi:hypothetical protein
LGVSTLLPSAGANTCENIPVGTANITAIQMKNEILRMFLKLNGG